MINDTIIIIIIFFFIIGLLVSIKILTKRVVPFVDQYLLTTEKNLFERYGEGSWALITGPSSGMGERFAHEFADRGFNLFLLGSKRTNKVIKEINKKYKKIKIIFMEIDFSRSFEDKFFEKIENQLEKIGTKWKILVNNVGYRTFSLNYEDMKLEEMKKTISVGTLVQSKLMQLAIKQFSKIKTNTCIINITAQVQCTTDLFAVDNSITVPHLACYEATNAWGYYHAKSVYSEIKDKYPQIDFLIICPGAVLTKNTENVLKDVIFAVDAETFVRGIIKLMGNKNGIYCAYWGHSLTDALINLFPFVDKESMMKKIGTDFSKTVK